MQAARFHILGAGKSGVAAANLLLDLGGTVILSDDADSEELRLRLEPLQRRGAAICLGGHEQALRANVDLAVVSPGLPPHHPALRRRRQQGVEVIGELELGWRNAAGTTTAVSGSNGKSTVVTLLDRILQAAGVKSYLCGNIGTPLSSVALQTIPGCHLVIEVSSYQLETVETFRAHVAVLLNITPDHVEHHGSFDAYCQAKARLFERQTSQDFAVFNRDDRTVCELAGSSPACKFPVSLSSLLPDGAFLDGGIMRAHHRDLPGRFELSAAELQLIGKHNQFNALCAAAAALCLGIDGESAAQAITSFTGLPHRLEFIRELDGIRYVNDSKATNVDAGRVGLQAVSSQVVLIAGGRPKGGGFRELREPVREKVRHLVVIGEAASELTEDLSDVVATETAGSLEEAVFLARKAAQPGDTVLLLPCAASFDMFRDFEDRGNQFRRIVMSLN